MSVVGIDLGTTNTVVGCVRAGKVHVLADEHGCRLLPSVVSFHPNGAVLVGHTAKARRLIDSRNTVYSHKRLLGRSWASPEIERARQRFAFELREGPGQAPLVHARGQNYTLPEISAFVLKRARQVAEQALGSTVDRAVITVPAHFNELQRASTKVAGRIAGLEILRILNEPTAAALAYGLGRTGNERVAVYDFGGGTFDCTLLDLHGNVFEVLATAGDSFLGGDDVDTIIADRMAETLLKQHRQDAKQDPQIHERLKASAEDIKVALSVSETHTVVLDDVAYGLGGTTLKFQFTMTRAELDVIVAPLVDRAFKVTQDALSLARLSPSSFDRVILVGGSTRIPLVRKHVESFFGAAPMNRINPEEVVAIGAAIQAAALTEGRRTSIPPPPGAPGRPSQPPKVRRTSETNAHTPVQSDAPASTQRAPSLAFGTIDEPPSLVSTPSVSLSTEPVPFMPPVAAVGDLEEPPTHSRSAAMPSPHHSVTNQPTSPNTGLGLNTTAPLAPPPGPSASAPPAVPPRVPLQPDGAAAPIFAASSWPPLDFASGELGQRAPVLVDVTPRGLVVETVGGYTDTIIPRNSKIPCERTRRFATGRDMQTSVRVRVAQGESVAFPENTYLGEVELSGLRPAARGGVSVAVTFEVDADGTLRVRARDVQTGQEARATLQLVGIADESSVVMMINRFAQQPVVGGSS